MSSGILVLRIVLGLTMAGHGAQKLFGWFGGGGLEGTATMFGGLRFRPALAAAVAAGLAEFGGGILFAAGFVTPLAACLICAVMLNAIATVHWPNGFWVSNGGYEFNLLIIASAVAVAATGPGRFSVDRLLRWDDNLSGRWWGLGVILAAALLSSATLALGRSPEQSRPAV